MNSDGAYHNYAYLDCLKELLKFKWKYIILMQVSNAGSSRSVATLGKRPPHFLAKIAIFSKNFTVGKYLEHPKGRFFNFFRNRRRVADLSSHQPQQLFLEP
jgi:hypothetical protein